MSDETGNLAAQEDRGADEHRRIFDAAAFVYAEQLRVPPRPFTAPRNGDEA